MNRNFTAHSEFEFGAFLFSVGVPKKLRVKSAAIVTAARFSQKPSNKEKFK
jgi:hypothetical protein